MEADNTSFVTLLFCIGYVLTCLASGLLVFKLLWALCHKVIEGGKFVLGVFGADLQQQLISLGLSCLIFHNTAAQLTRSVVQSLIDLITIVPKELYASWSLGENLLRGRRWSDACSQLTFAVAQSWSHGFSQALREFAAVSLTDIVLVIGTAAFAGWLMKNAHLITAPERDVGKSQYSVRLQNLFFFFLFGLAIYLSIGAIAAISVLQNPTAITEQVSAAKLKEVLENELQASEGAFADQSPKISPFSELEKKLVDESDRQILSPLVNQCKTLRDGVLNGYASLVGGFKKQRDDAISQAIRTYETNNYDRKGGKEAARYFLDIETWYHRRLAAMEHSLSEAFDRLKMYEMFWSQLAQTLTQALVHQDVNETAESRHERLNQAISTGVSNLSGFYSALPPITTLSDDDQTLPERRTLGSDLGIFSWLASWILQTESLSLALIVGMIGFGLLGSASSAFIRERATRGEGQPLVADLTGIIIRGISAAILVFLAVEGGLAVFGIATSGPSPEPNPFVIFLTCLVAAVFSDNVWQTARERLSEALHDKHAGGGVFDAQAKAVGVHEAGKEEH
jgi:hypothetical protein